MQKIINVLAISSFAISLTVVGGGVYLYTQKDAIIDGVKSKVMKSVMPQGGDRSTWEAPWHQAESGVVHAPTSFAMGQSIQPL